MRQVFTGWAAAAALLGIFAAPASAQACGPHAACYGPGYGGYIDARYIGVERLPTIPVPRYYAPPQYFWVNQGPVYNGPGNFAPYGYYGEPSGWYGDGLGYSYNGGPYANAYHHYYPGIAARGGPVIYRYNFPPTPRAHRAYRPVRYGHPPRHYRYGVRYSSPRVVRARATHAPRGAYRASQASPNRMR
ncbi:MAG TPA: hypothetical protein VNZ94_06790 [Xanthobacteraceae bacterium]|nr:hypothetical protein [Xanthobacteraceae bacterium]